MERAGASWRDIKRLAILGTMLASGFLVGCQDNIEFTRKPIEKAQSGERPTVRTPIFVVARADGAFLKSEAAGRIPERVMRIRRRLPRAACVEKNGRTRCVSARVTGTVLQQGDITLAGATDGFALKIPMAYKFDVKGSGVARDVEDVVDGTFVVTARFHVSLDEAWASEIAYRGEIDARAADNIKILRGKIDLAKAIARNLRTPLRRLAGSFEDSLDTSPASKIVHATWRHLHYPVSLRNEPPLWLRGEPRKIAFGGVAVSDDNLEFRLALLADIKTYTGERPVPLIANTVPSLDLQPLAIPDSHLIMPVELPYSEIASRIQSAFEEQGPIQPKENGKAKSFVVKSIKLFPAGGRLALAVGLEADIDGNWQKMTGTAYVLATPRVEDGTALLGLKLVEFSAPTQSPALFDNGRFILPQKPFADAFRRGMSMDLKDRFTSVLAQANQISQSDFAKGNQLRGRFDDMNVHSIETMETGLRINLDLVGALSVYPGSDRVTSGLGRVEAVSSEQ